MAGETPNDPAEELSQPLNNPSEAPDSSDREHIRALNQENARRRIENRQLTDTLTALNEKLKAFEPLITKVSEMEKNLQAEREARQRAEQAAMRARVAGKFGLPEELAARLQGDDEQALEADAATLAQFAQPRRGAGGQLPAGNPGAGVANGPSIAAQIKGRMGGKKPDLSPFFDPAVHRRLSGEE